MPKDKIFVLFIDPRRHKSLANYTTTTRPKQHRNPRQAANPCERQGNYTPCPIFLPFLVCAPWQSNRKWGKIGSNYLKGLFALGFQGFLMMICVGIYAVLVNGIIIADNLHGATFSLAAYTVILCFSLFKSSALAKSIRHRPICGRVAWTQKESAWRLSWQTGKGRPGSSKGSYR